MKLLVYALFVSSLSFAAPEYVPIQERAQGRSLTGGTLLNDSLFSNPASSAFVQAYTLDGSFLPPKSFAISVLDTRTSSVGGALGYFRVNDDDGFDPLHGAKLGMFGRVSNVVGVGVAGKLIWGPKKDATGMKLNESSRMTDFDLGVTTFLGNLQAGASVRNVMGGDTTLGFNREASVGARINYEKILFVSFATQSKFSDLKPYQYGFGAEYMTPYYISIKGGFRSLPYEGKGLWSAGASFVSPMLSLHYAVEFPHSAADNYQHSLGATMSF